MTLVNSLLLFKFALISGLAVWMTIIAANNLTAFAGGVASLGGLMSMQLFDQDPAIKTPLLTRRVRSPTLHRLAYSFIMAIEALVVVLLWYAVIGFAFASVGSLDGSLAIARANVALSAFVTMSFVFAIGGAWFAYYIRQDALQITHLAYMGVALGSAIAVNMQ